MDHPIKAARPALARPARRPIHHYHWILLALWVGLTVLISAPTLWSAPVIYETTATATVDPRRYQAFFSDPAVQKHSELAALEAVKHDMARQGLEGFGTNRFGVKAVTLPTGAIVAENGTVELRAQSLSPASAQVAADQSAYRLAQTIRAAAGRDLLRRLMSAELNDMWQNAPPASPFNAQLRSLIARQAFDFPLRVASERLVLSAEDYLDILCALEVRYDQLEWEMAASVSPAQISDIQNARSAINTFLKTELYPRTVFRGPEPSAAYVSGAALLPVTPQSQNLTIKLALVLLVGLIGGVLLVLVDRSVGIVDKISELWGYRELVRNLVLRDLKARYKSSVLGYVWSLLNPLLMIMLFYFVFKTLLRSPIADFHIFLMVALLPWNFFSGSVMEGMFSIVGNGHLVKKVYFPREILPIASILANLINFLLSLPVLFAVIWISGGPIALSALLMPLIIVIETMFTLGIVLFLSAISVFFRDTTHIMGVLIQFWMFLTPIFYSLESIGSATFIKLLRWINPMASLIDFYRDILYGGLAIHPQVPTPGLPALDGVARTVLTAIAVLAMGSYVFHRLSGRFGEEL